MCNWIDYLKHGGLFNGKIKTPQELTELFKNNKNARLAVKLVGGDEVDLADILTVVDEKRLDKKKIMELLKDPSVRAFLGKYQRPPITLRGILKPAEELLKLDKDDVIKGILEKRLIEYRRRELGANPSAGRYHAFMNELERELERTKI